MRNQLPAKPPSAPRYYTTEHGNLSLCTYNQEFHDKYCKFWYAVTEAGLAHIAFKTRKGLMNWLVHRGLRLTQELPDEGTGSCQAIAGKYRTSSWVNYEAFQELNLSDYARDHGLKTKVLSNMHYTLGLIFQDQDQVMNVNFLNPNITQREIFDYQTTHAQMS